MSTIPVNRFYVYALLDPSIRGNFVYEDYWFEYEPFYIGKGTGKRITSHKLTSSIKYKNSKNSKIISIHNTGLEFITLKVIDNVTEEDALKKETELVKIIGRKDLGKGPLCNLTDGGRGPYNTIISKERREIISNWHKGKTVSEETKKKQSVGIKKYFENNTHKRAISVININTGQLYKSALDAAKDINGESGHILEVCRGIRQVHKGIKWGFAKDYPEWSAYSIHEKILFKRKITNRNKSGHVGVFWSNVHSKWIARIKVNYKIYHLGSFDSKEKAIEAREIAEMEYFSYL